MAQRQPQPLTAEELALAVRLLRDPEARARLGDALRRTYFNPDFWRRTGQVLSETYFNPEFWRRVADLLRETYLNPDVWQRAAEAAAKTYSPENLAAMASAVTEAYAEAFGARPDGSDLVDAAREFEGEMKAAEAMYPHPREPAPLAWWLVTRTGQAQLGLLLSALLVLDKLTRFAEDVTGVDGPTGLGAATDAVFAVAAFLLLWVQYRYQPPEDR